MNGGGVHCEHSPHSRAHTDVVAAERHVFHDSAREYIAIKMFEEGSIRCGF